MNKGRTPDPSLPGLARMIAAAFPWECPFCQQARKVTRTKKQTTCGEPECRTAYMRCWRRDARRGVYRKKQAKP